MAAKQQAKKTEPKRGLLARPLDALVFLLPLILFYEIMCMTQQNDRVIAFDLMRRFFELFGHLGMWAPGLGAIAILLATHVVSGEKWAIHWPRVWMMYPEAVALAVPLLALNWTIPLTGLTGSGSLMWDRLAMGIGAGIYEELVFRLVLISIVMMIGVDLLRQNHTWVALAAVVISALAFAAHHHPPIGVEPFATMPFLFRCVAGSYLAIIFWYRGYGPAAGCHAAYNVALACLNGGDLG
jgi:membrane protease YdiL (CAAX protease family)